MTMWEHHQVPRPQLQWLGPLAKAEPGQATLNHVEDSAGGRPNLDAPGSRQHGAAIQMPPDWQGVKGIIIVVLQLVNATLLRFFTSVYAPGEVLSPFVIQNLVNPFSSRIYALFVLIGVALWHREPRPLGYLLLVAATVEIIDALTITVNVLGGNYPVTLLGFAVPVLLFIAFYLLSARRLLRA